MIQDPLKKGREESRLQKKGVGGREGTPPPEGEKLPRRG